MTDKRDCRVHFKIKGCQVKNVDEKMEVIAFWERNGKTQESKRAGRLAPNK